MRILTVHPGPAFSVADVYAGWVEALKTAGQRVLPFNLDDALAFHDNAYMRVDEGIFRKALTADQAIERSAEALLSVLYRTHPDVLFIVTGFLLSNEILDLARHRGTKVVVLHTESPYEDARQIEQAQHADLNLINDPTNIDQFPAGTLYMPHAYRPARHKPGPVLPPLACDLGFVATAFPSRIKLLEAMDLDGLDVVLAGNWRWLTADSPLKQHVAHGDLECVDNGQAIEVYRSARVGLNYYRREGDDGDDYAGWSMGPREVEQAATGMFFLRDPRPEGDQVLHMLPTFTSPGEASELLRWYLAHPEQRHKAAQQAREAIAERTFDNNARTLLTALEGI